MLPLETPVTTWRIGANLILGILVPAICAFGVYELAGGVDLRLPYATSAFWLVLGITLIAWAAWVLHYAIVVD